MTRHSVSINVDKSQVSHPGVCALICLYTEASSIVAFSASVLIRYYSSVSQFIVLTDYTDVIRRKQTQKIYSAKEVWGDAAHGTEKGEFQE